MTFKQKRQQRKNGFTMIELLVVIVILGILSVVGLGSFSSSQMKARDSRRKTDIRAIGDALELYYNDYGSYPLDDDAGQILGCGTIAEKGLCSPGTIWQNPENSTTYMVQMPEDPNGGMYFYISPTGTSYQIYAHLENDQDRDVPEDQNGNPTYYLNPVNPDSNQSCIIGNCNYGKSSTNIDLGLTN